MGQVEAAEDLPEAALDLVAHHRLAHLLGDHDAHAELGGGKPLHRNVPPPPRLALAEPLEGPVAFEGKKLAPRGGGLGAYRFRTAGVRRQRPF
ncbi:hypothetical protein TthSNM66_16160 [Thermus thermophilus]|nr:hypothetical protein TthSNM66_16160 [Thermus thermophilus]